MKNTLANFSADMKKNLILIVALIAIGLIGRIIPHAYNFTPMTAIALLSAYAFKNKWIAIGLPLLSFWISDLIINNFKIVFCLLFINQLLNKKLINL